MNGQRKGGGSANEGWRNDETLARMCADCGVHAAELLRIVMHVGLRPDQAEIVMQKAWLKFLVEPPVLEEDTAEHWRRWFLTVIRNTAVDMVRYLRRHPAQSLDALLREPRDWHDEEAAERAGEEWRLELLRAGMEELREIDPRNYRLLHGLYFEHLHIEELAKREGLTPHAVWNRLNRVRHRLRAWLLKHEDEDTDSE